jgi:hypothetical protein
MIAILGVIAGVLIALGLASLSGNFMRRLVARAGGCLSGSNRPPRCSRYQLNETARL